MVASCSDRTAGDPSVSGQEGGSTSGDSGAGSPDVPQVKEPLDAGPYLKRPCDVIANSVINSVGNMRPGEPDVNSDTAKKLTGPSCGWFPKGNERVQFSLLFETVHRDNGTGGIKGVYKGKEVGLTDYVEPVDIPGHAGYPAAFSGSKDDQDKGECSLAVGITNNFLFSVHFTNWENPNQACPSALKVAASALDTLKEGN
nr:DUF3558 domain-containing protein [Haloechinothrix halophila]